MARRPRATLEYAHTQRSSKLRLAGVHNLHPLPLGERRQLGARLDRGLAEGWWVQRIDAVVLHKQLGLLGGAPGGVAASVPEAVVDGVDVDA